MEKNLQNPIVIDAVIIWVDGSDVNYQHRMAIATGKPEFINSRQFKLKYSSVGEVKYAVHSIIKFAPFIRNIYIVTDQQKPAFLKNKAEVYRNVRIVDHKDIFKKHPHCLPVYNSRSIETKLYEVPGLSEHFIYLNDDFFLFRKVEPTDFFIDGKPVLRGRWQNFRENIFFKKFTKKAKSNRPFHTIAQEKGAKVLGLGKFYKFHHTPQPLRKSTISSFFEKERELEERNASFKFRSREQFLCQGLANHIEIINKTGILKRNYQLVHIKSYKKPLFWLKFYLNYMGRKPKKIFLNLQNLDQCPEHQLEYVLKWLERKYALD